VGKRTLASCSDGFKDRTEYHNSASFPWFFFIHALKRTIKNAKLKYAMKVAKLKHTMGVVGEQNVI